MYKRYWQIVASVTNITSDGYRSTTQIPTFYLDSAVQGILTEDHAVKKRGET